jgi:hydrogenase maturation factor
MIGKVIDVQDNDVVVEYEGQSCSAKFYGMDIEQGDWVLVESGYVMSVMNEAEAMALMNQESSEEDEDIY